MDSVTLYCTAALAAAGGIYWFVCVLGPAERKGKRALDLSGGSISAENVKDNYNQYWSFFRKPKEIETAEKVPDFVDTFYNLVTDIYEWGWGQSFHFSPSIPGKSDKDATRIHEEMAIYRVMKPGSLYVSYEWVTTDKYRDEDEEHREVIQGIERGDALPGMRRYSDIAAAARRVGFEVVQEKDLAKPPAKPWWNRLKMGRIAYWRNHVVVVVLSAVGIAPKGTVDVHEMLFKTADYLSRGGETGIFSPMHMILCRKPEKASSE
ncbi:hypothetical protein HID58_027887 [Brassica napus]|uniref:SAM-dependent methyltransferase Erg6/SMT-type domain-containing protein n=1 Tax=Brassica napus TaxID=3708 RepID=A0ABQ8CTU1_BRANA|nr:hypothetical protein HID58_027887 [Brassica napus]